MPTDLAVANTILAQLGGNKFIAMTGAKDLTGRSEGLSFRIGRNAKSVTHVRVTLDSADTYQIQFLRIRGVQRTLLSTWDGIYAERLAHTFTVVTGMETHL